MTYRFGILGPGRIASVFASLFRSGLAKGATLYGVASSSQNRAIEFAAEYHIPHVFASYESLLACSEIDAVYISNLNMQHYNCCMDAIRYKKHILCEKPMCISSQQAEQLAKAAEQAGVFIMEAMWSCFTPAFQMARQWLDEGRTGGLKGSCATLCFARNPSEFPRLFQREQGGGALLDLGIYGIAFTLHFASPRQLLHADVSSVPVGQVDESSYLRLHYSGNFVGEVRCSIGYQAINDACIFGDKGFIRLEPAFHFGHKVALYTQPYPAASYSSCLTPEKVYEARYENRFEFLLSHMVDCLNQGLAQSPVVPLVYTQQAARIFDKAAALKIQFDP